jgi:hypothetical protein
MMRYGLQLDTTLLKNDRMSNAKIALLPAIGEAVTVSLLGLWLLRSDTLSLGDNYLLSCIQAFALAGLSPTILFLISKTRLIQL